MSASEEMISNVFGATLTRRGFVKGTGALVVAVGMPAGFTASAGAEPPNDQLDPSQLSSWLTINPDNTVRIRTGSVNMGNGTTVAYRQIVAEELNVPFDSITGMVIGSTDETPDGGTNDGMGSSGGQNLRLVSAITYQALLGLASTRLGVPVANLTVTNGVVSGGGNSISYGELVQDQQLNLTIPTSGPINLPTVSTVTVTATVPTKPVSDYSVVGQSYPDPYVPPVVTGTATWVEDVTLPGLLAGRMVKPPTFGSTLVSVGALDKNAFPNTQLVVKGNLVGVVAPTDWEAIGAAGQVAAKTKWTDWTGLPGSGNLFEAMESNNYSIAPVINGANNKGNAGAALASAAKTMSATYYTPFIKQAPIGPSVAVANVQNNADGSVASIEVWTHSQSAQPLRAMLAQNFGISPDNVVNHWVDGPGHYGRSNAGPDGAEVDAAILSQAVGKPVRVQWMRPEDMQWSVTTFATVSKMQAGLDANGNLTALQGDYYMSGRFDGRGLGALLAGMPPGGTDANSPLGPSLAGGHYSWNFSISTSPQIYDQLANVLEYGHESAPFGQVESPYKVGMRIHSMRTPVQRQENFALEGMINEIAAAVGVDPIEYRLRFITNPVPINVINTLKQVTNWQSRPSPSPDASATGSTPVTGRGMGIMLRSNGYHAAAAEVTVTPSTGNVAINWYTTVVDLGITVNPGQVKRNAEAGAQLGLSEVLHEETAFDKSIITSTDWVSYPIMRFVDLPTINAVVIPNPARGVYGQGSEGFNGLPMVAVTAAFFDATGKVARTFPLRPANVKAILNT